MSIQKAQEETPKRRRPPARTPEERENQMISAAIDLAEQQILAGTASSQVITHFLKLGSSKERIGNEILSEQKKLIVAKTESIQSAKRVEELYTEAMAAFRAYSGMESDATND